MPHTESVVVADKARSTVEEKGIVKLLPVLPYNNANDQPIDLPVFYMPDSPANLLSISALEKQGVY